MSLTIFIIVFVIQIVLLLLFFICLVSITSRVGKIYSLLEKNDTSDNKRYSVDKKVKAILKERSTQTLVSKEFANDQNIVKEYLLNKNNEIVVNYYCQAIKTSEIDGLAKEIKKKIDVGELKVFLENNFTTAAKQQIADKYEGATLVDSFIKYRINIVARKSNIILIKDN